MSCPVKYRRIGDFNSYYSGARKAPYLTIFVGGNHEASNHLWELFYGGWVAPNIYYMGAANVIRLGGVRIAGMSGIWKGYDYRRPHFERLPYNQDDIRSIYHVREIDTRKLLQIRTNVDIGISHDWPKTIELHGNKNWLFKNKPDFEQESKSGTFGNEAAKLVMDRLRPAYWFSAHMHCKYAATKVYKDSDSKDLKGDSSSAASYQSSRSDHSCEPIALKNVDEIELDLEPTIDSPPPVKNLTMCVNRDGIFHNDKKKITVSAGTLAELPAAFSHPQPSYSKPPEITNKIVRFLSLDKCLPGRKFLQLLTVIPSSTSQKSPRSPRRLKPTLEYDPEWLAITRVFNSSILLGDRSAQTPPDLGEEHYLPLIQKEKEWVDENIVQPGKLKIPHNFVITAPPYKAGSPEIVREDPREYNNPQTQQFCDLIGIRNHFFATEEERMERLVRGPDPVNEESREESRMADFRTRQSRSKNGQFRNKRHGPKRNRGRN